MLPVLYDVVRFQHGLMTPLQLLVSNSIMEAVKVMQTGFCLKNNVKDNVVNLKDKVFNCGL